MNRITGFAVGLALVAMVAGCKGKSETPQQADRESAAAAGAPKGDEVNVEAVRKAAAAMVEEYGTVVGGLYRESALAYWKAANTGDKAAFDEYAAKDLEVKKYHSDPVKFKQIQEFLAKRDQLDPMTARSLQVMELGFKENQLPKEMLEKLVTKASEIEMTFNTFRAEIGGRKFTNNELLDVLGKETDVAKRKEAWEALKQVGEKVAPMLLDLARTRNEAARMLGYENFWDMRMRLQEHDPVMVTKLFEDLQARTDEAFKSMKAELDGEIGRRFETGTEDLMPWHYDNPFFQQAPAAEAFDPDMFYKGKTKEDVVSIGQQFFADIGIPIDEIVTNSDFYEREGKDQHAFCSDFDRKGDVRMLLNVKPTAEWMDTMLHESGHAAYAKFNDPALPWVLRDSAHILTTEGVAMLFGAATKSPTWLKAYAKADPAEADRYAGALAKQRKREQLIFSRWAMVMFFFERDLYANPDRADLNALWYDYVEKLQGLKRPVDRNLADWASKPHFTIAPVYYHNYLLGEMFAGIMRKKLAEMAGHQGPTSLLSFVGRKDFGEFLVSKVFKPGMSLPWPEFVEKSFGAPFSADAFVSEVQ